MEVSTWRGVLFVVLAAVAWGGGGIAARIIYEQGGTAEDVITGRIILGFIGITLWVRLFVRKVKIFELKRINLVIISGLFSVALNSVFYFYAVSKIGAGLSAALLYTALTWSYILAIIFLSEKLTMLRVLLIALASVGVMLAVALFDDEIKVDLFGTLAALGSGLTYATYGIINKKLLKEIEAEALLVRSFGIASAVFLPYFLWNGGLGRTLNLEWEGWLAFGYLGLVNTSFGYAFYTMGLKHIEASKATLIATLEPVAALVLATLMLNEVMSLTQVIGVSLIIASAAMAAISRPSRRSNIPRVRLEMQ